MALRDAWNPSSWGSAQHAADDFGGPSYIASGLAVTAAAGRFGGAGLVFTNAQAYVSQALANEVDAYIGFGLKGTGPACIIRFMDDATEQCSLWLRSDGKLEARRGSTVLGTGTAVISSTVHRWVEVNPTIDATTGAFYVKVDGVSDIAVTGADTNQTTNEYMTQWRFGEGAAASSTVSFTIADGYHVDATGGVNDDYLGNVRADAKLPTAAGSTSGWTGAYTAIDEATPNDDTDYLSTAAGSAALSSFAMADLSGTIASVKGIVVKTRGKRTDAGGGIIQHYVKVAAATTTGADRQHAAGAYDTLKTPFDVQPDASAWDEADWNAAEVGVQEAT